MPRLALRLSALAAAALPLSLGAQNPAPANPPASGAGTQPTAQPTTSPVEVSGVIYPYFIYGGAKGNRSQDRFDLERAYLTIRAKIADRTSIRVTGDVFQNAQNGTAAADRYYRGWTLRAKYAYLQYDYLTAARPTDLAATARLGILHTVLIDHEEQFWPRWIAQSAVERTGFFSSADAGASTLITLPGRVGEIYGTVTNGEGYANPERDRFKDYAVRLSFTPFAAGAGLLKSLAISPWAYKGNFGSQFATVAAGQKRDRWGVFAGLRDPRLTLGAEYAERTTAVESGTAAAPVSADDKVRLASGFVWLRPFLPAGSAPVTGLSGLGLVFRYDDAKDVDRRTLTSTGFNNGHFLVAGVTLDVNRRLALSADYQQQSPRDGAAFPDLRGYYVHASASF